MKDNLPFISIITVVYNGASFLEATIQSVISQGYGVIEYIIIDGASTDGTIEIIKKHEHKLSYWISEPDKGIYDAMNKGIEKATGSFVYFINCGDTLLSIPGDLRNSEADMFCFPVETNTGLRKPKLGFTFFLTNTLPHQGIFYKKSADVFFDCTYKVFADYALNIDFRKSGKQIKMHNEPVIAYHSLDGVSNNKKSFAEFLQLVKAKSGIHFMVLSYLYFKWQGFKRRLL
ncbi:MAG: glycosyltransferase family 2 protein [Panacibacter sp.]